MFVEKVNVNSLEDYLSTTVGYPVSVKRVENGIYAKIETGYYGPQPEYLIEDFDVKALNSYGELNKGFFWGKCKEYYLQNFVNYKSEYNKHIESQLIK